MYHSVHFKPNSYIGLCHKHIFIARIFMNILLYYTLGRVGVAVLSNQIYAIGGYDGLANLSSVEVYNPETEEWKPAPPLMRHQGGVVVAVIPSE